MGSWQSDQLARVISSPVRYVIYVHSKRLFYTINNSILYTTYVGYLNRLLCRLSLRLLLIYHLLHMRERLLSPNRHDTAGLRNMRLLLVALYAIACYL